MARRMDLLNKITRQLSILAYEIELMNRSNRMTLNSDAETIFCGLINRLEGWELRNLNEVEQNFPGIDLADTGRRIAVQITATGASKKVSHTLEVFFKNHLDRDFDRLIVVIITDKTAPGGAYKVERGFKFNAKRDIWNVEWFKRRVESIEDCELLQTIADYLDSQLGELPGDVKLPAYLLPLIPAQSEAFLDGSRDRELDDMAADLEAGKTVFVWGLGGMGKTQAAIALAKRCAGARGAYFLPYTLPTESGREAMMETILQADFWGFRSDETDPQRAYEQRMDILRREYAGTVLVIDHFDCPGKNLDQLKGEKSCQDLLALTNAGLTLIFTTRYPVGVPEWEIGPLKDEQLLELMHRSCKDPAVTDDELLALIRTVDGHTLMADLMAKTLEESWSMVTPAQMLEALRHNALDVSDFPEVTNDQNGIYAHARIYKHMQTLFNLAGLTEQAKNVLRCATLLPEDGLADRLFMRCVNAEEQQELRSLVKRGWLRREDRKIIIHPAVRQVCAGELGFKEEDPFLEALKKLCAEEECADETLRQTARTFAAAAQRMSDPAKALECLKVGLGIWKKLVPAMERDLAEYDSWKDPYTRLGDKEQALGFKMGALSIKNRALAPHHPAVAAALGNVGQVYLSMEDYKRALEYNQKSLAVWEKVYKDPNPDLARAYSNLARTCYEMGDHVQALEWLEQSRQIWSQILNAGHPNIQAVERNMEHIRKQMQ